MYWVLWVDGYCRLLGVGRVLSIVCSLVRVWYYVVFVGKFFCVVIDVFEYGGGYVGIVNLLLYLVGNIDFGSDRKSMYWWFLCCGGNFLFVV